MKWRIAILSVLSGLVSLPAIAHEGHEHGSHHLMGTVTAVDASHLELKTTEGKTLSVALTPETEFVKAKATAQAKDVQVGTRVMIDTVEGREAATAKKVTIGTAKAEPQPTPKG